MATAVVEIERDLQDLLAAWVDPEAGRQWDLITLAFVDDPRTIASAHRFKQGMSQIRIGRRLVESVLDLSAAAWADWRGGEDIRQWSANHLAKLVMRFVFYHEFAHINRGHLYELARRSGEANARFAWAETDTIIPRGCVRIARWMERDADIIGSDFFAMFTVLGPWRKRPVSMRRTYLMLCLSAGALATLQLERFRQEHGGDDSVHDKPYTRWLTLTQAMGGSLARELRLSEEDVIQATGSALYMLADLATQLGLPPELWALHNMKQFRTCSLAHDRTMRRHGGAVERYLQDRSSFLPDVGMSTTDIGQQVSSKRRRLGRSDDGLT